MNNKVQPAADPDTKPAIPPKPEPPAEKPPLFDDEPAGSRKLTRFFSALSGIIAIGAFSLFLPAYWLTQTFSDRQTFTDIASSIAQTDAARDYVAQEISSQLTREAKPSELQESLGTADRTAAQQEIQQRIVAVLENPETDDLLQDSVTKLHSGFFDSQAETINLRPELERLLTLLEDNQLSFLANVELEDNAGVITVRDNEQLTQVRNINDSLQNSWLWFLVVAVIAGALSIYLASRKLRRLTVLAIWIAVICATYLAMIFVMTKLPIGGDDPQLSQVLQDATEQSLAILRTTSTWILLGALAAIVVAQILSRRKSESKTV